MSSRNQRARVHVELLFVSNKAIQDRRVMRTLNSLQIANSVLCCLIQRAMCTSDITILFIIMIEVYKILHNKYDS